MGHQLAVVRCEFVQFGEGVLHLEKRQGTRRVHCTGRIRDYRRGCPPFRCDIYKIVTIKVRAPQRDKTIAALDSPRVSADVPHRPIRITVHETRVAQLS